MKAILIFSVLFLSLGFVCKAQNQMGLVGLGYIPQTVTITTDNQVLNVTTKNYVILSSDNANANNRTVILSRGSVFGQQLIIEFIGANTCQFTDDSTLSGGGNLRIAGGFNMTSFDILGLIWNGVDWVQHFRSVN